jgi:hypothetical protein
MQYSEFLNLHPLERAAMAEFAVALEKDRREFKANLVEALAKSLSG